MKTKFKRSLSIVLTLVLTLSLFSRLSLNNVKAYEFEENIEATKTLSTREVFLDMDNSSNNEIEVKYKLTFLPLAVEEIDYEPKEKEIVFVIDTSESMSEPFDSDSSKTRIKGVQDSVVNFLKQMKDNPSVKVAIVDFNEKATVFNENEPLLSVHDNFDTLKAYVNSLTLKEGTNTGDGLRRASYILDEDSDKEQYVVLLTDGEANAFSFDDGNYYTPVTPDGDEIGYVYTNYGADQVAIDKFKNKSYNFYLEDGIAETYFVNVTGAGDYDNKARDYLYKANALFKNTDIKTHYMALGNNPPQNQVETIAQSIQGEDYITVNENALKSILNDLVVEIDTEIVLTGVEFEEVFPDNITVTDLNSGFSLKNQTVSKTFTIPYKLNNNGSYLNASTINFTIGITPAETGYYELGANNTSGIHFDDLNGDPVDVYFNSTGFNANEPDPNLSEDGTLNVLEIQPDVNFELNKGLLETAFEDMIINYVPMTLNQYNGHVDKVNGKFDIIYIGATENYSNNTITGIGNGSISTITVDVDITDKKSEDIKEFVNSGQLIYMDSDIASIGGTKLKALYSDLESGTNVLGNNENVKLISTMNEAVLNNMYKDYTDEDVVHRPSLTVLSMPSEYDGTSASLSNSHNMGYAYTAYNRKNAAMDLYLYADYDGDGVYEEKEKVEHTEISKNAANLTVNYQLEDDFNGVMPWKLELVDRATGAKDYMVGYAGYKGAKTIVSVLQLTPGVDENKNLDIGGNKFTKDLITDDYEIYVTYMETSKFDQAYADWETSGDLFPAEVDGNPTVLNGNYDMIILGFGDSYGGKGEGEGSRTNKDIKSDAAVDAIKDFMDTGQSIMFTHDTAGPQDVNNTETNASGKLYNEIVTYNDAPNITENFKTDMGFSNTRTYAGKKMWRAWNTNMSYKLNDGLITRYPYILAENTTLTLPIATTHDQYWEIDLEGENVVPWFTLDAGDFKYYPSAYYYTFSNGNVTYSGTGHSNPSGEEEQELFVNTMMKASRTSNHAPTLYVAGLYDNMNVEPDDNFINFKLTIQDIDYQDQEFDTKVYIVIDGTAYEVFHDPAMPKDIEQEISVEKPDELDDTVDSFEIKIVTYDEHGAKAEKEFHSTHRSYPGVELTNGTYGVLIGDYVDVNYVMTSKRQATHPDDVNIIKDINLSTTINTSVFSVISSTNWTKTGSVYMIEPAFDNTTTAADESLDHFSLRLKALAKTTGSGESIVLSGDYDVDYDTGDTDMTDVEIVNTSTVDVKDGTINVNILQYDYNGEGDDRELTGDTIKVYDSSNVLMDTKVIPDTGLVSFNELPTDTYTIKAELAGTTYALISDTLAASLSYSNPSVDVTFEVNDMTPPELNLFVGQTVYSISGVDTKIVHIKADGVHSDIVEVYYKKLSTGSSSHLDFEGVNAATNLVPSDYDLTSPYADIQTSAFDLTGTYVDGYYFEATETGPYAVYIKNRAGHVVVKVINVIFDFPNII